MRSYTLGLYEKALPNDINWETKLNAVKKCGFDFLEISIDESDERLLRLDWSEEQHIALKNAIHSTKIPILSMCLSAHRRFPMGAKSEEQRDKSIQIIEKAIAFSIRHGIRIIQLAGYDEYYEKSDYQTREFFLKNLRYVCNLASKYRLILAFETMETEFMDTVEKAMKYISDMNCPYLGIYPDIGNLTNASEKYNNNIVDDLNMGSGHIFSAHIKETTSGVYRNLSFGNGHTKYTESLSALYKMGVRSYVAEMWYLGSLNWKAELSYAAEFCRRHLDDLSDVRF